MPVVDIQDIRRKNLALLLLELERELGRERGVQAELSRRTKVPAPVLSQFINHRLHSDGAPRNMGDSTARSLERGMNKPRGWMDVLHDDAFTADDIELARAIQALNDNQREAIRNLINAMSVEAPTLALPAQDNKPKH